MHFVDRPAICPRDLSLRIAQRPRSPIEISEREAQQARSFLYVSDERRLPVYRSPITTASGRAASTAFRRESARRLREGQRTARGVGAIMPHRGTIYKTMLHR